MFDFWYKHILHTNWNTLDK